MNYLAAELTRYQLELSFRHEAELRGTNPKEIRKYRRKKWLFIHQCNNGGLLEKNTYQLAWLHEQKETGYMGEQKASQFPVRLSYDGN